MAARSVDEGVAADVMYMSRLLGEFGQIERVTLLPDGRRETDSHHCFSLALMAYELASQLAPELDSGKVLMYSLVHDLSEIVTGDQNTLLASSEKLESKAQRDSQALSEVEQKLHCAPHILAVLRDYEAKADEESLYVYWLDKVMTIPTHFYDKGVNLQKLGIRDQEDIQEWYKRTLKKLNKQRPPHASAAQVLEMMYRKMHDELLGPRAIAQTR